MKKFLVIICSLFLASCSTTVRRTSNFQQLLPKYKKAILLPSDVVMYQNSFVGKKERVDNYEYFLEELVNQEAKSELEKLGLIVTFLSKKEMHEAKISREFSILSDEYLSLRKSIFTPLEVPSKKALLSGMKVGNLSNFARIYPADIYILVNYEGIIKTSGAVARDMLAFAAFPLKRYDANQQYFMFVSVVDVQTQEIVWANVSIEEKSGFFDNIFASKEAIERKNIKALLKSNFSKLKTKI